MRKQTAVWTTRDGHKVRLCDMTDTHLINTIRFLRRWANRKLDSEIALGYQVLATLQGEMAQFYAEQDIDRLECEDAESLLLEDLPIYEKLLTEAHRRKIVVDDL